MPQDAVTWSKMRTFAAVAHAGSIRVAAAQLHVTEPAVSTAVASIERQLRAKLTARSGRGIILTEAGHVYAEYCRQILGLLDESAIAVRRSGLIQLRVGAVETASEYVVPTLLAHFHGLHPEVRLSMTVQPRDDLFASIAHHELDVVFGGRPPQGSGLAVRAVRSNRLIVVSAPGWDRSAAESLWLLRGRGSGTLDTTLSLFEQLQITPRTLTLGSTGAVLAAAQAGLGLTLVHEDAAADGIAASRLVQVHVRRTPIKRPWHLVTGSTPTAAATLFISTCASDELGTAAFQHRRRTRTSADDEHTTDVIMV